MIKKSQMLFEPFGLPEREREAIEYIKSHEPADGYQVGFSGGKDSIVTLDLVKRSGVKYEAHCSIVAGNDEPEVLRFIRKNYPEVKLMNHAGAGRNFFSLTERKGVPTIKRRWCCSAFKETYGTNVIVGIRAEESKKRASRPRTEQRTKKKTLFKPIFYWNEAQVWEYIEERKLPYPSLYDTGRKRLGCIVCPFSLGGIIAVKTFIEML